MSQAAADTSEIIITSAKLRRDLELSAYRKLLRQLYGDDAFWAEVEEAAALDHKMREQPPAPPEVRRKVNLWAWRKRMRGY